MIKYLFLPILLCFISLHAKSQDIFIKSQGATTRWTSFENRSAAKGEAAKANKGAKGNAFERFPSGATLTLLDIKGTGIVQRIWLTLDDSDVETLRSIRIEMYWNDSEAPAVSCPLSDFFCNGLAQMVSFENCYFSNPEGRSFNVSIPMPFKSAARIIVINESPKNIPHLFYDVNLTMLDKWDENMLYFHSFYQDKPFEVGDDFLVLPKTTGSGRFLGVSIGIITDSLYQKTWWGEGEIKFFIDGDKDYPTLAATGVEDYIGTAWGQGIFQHTYQGCPIADEEKGEWAFYRFHVKDPVFFNSDIKVTLQQIGGADYNDVLKLHNEGVNLIPITIDQVDENKFVRLFELETIPKLSDFDFPKGWVNFYRKDKITSTAYYYIDKPSK